MNPDIPVRAYHRRKPYITFKLTHRPKKRTTKNRPLGTASCVCVLSRALTPEEQS